MKKFIALYHAPDEAVAKAREKSMSDDERAEAMKPWMEWNQRSGEAIVDLGAPLIGGESANTENQWQSSTKGVRGYSIVQAPSKEAAKALFENHVHLNWMPEATVELHEVAEM